MPEDASVLHKFGPVDIRNRIEGRVETSMAGIQAVNDDEGLPVNGLRQEVFPLQVLEAPVCKSYRRAVLIQ